MNAFPTSPPANDRSTSDAQRPPRSGIPFDAVVLAGGGGTRLGGVDKAAVDLAGRPLVEASLQAAANARTIVVVGATSAPMPSRVLVTREEPTGTGPAAAFARGVGAVPDPAAWTLLLGCDLPGAAAAANELFEALEAGTAGPDGAVMTDPSGREQWVLGLYRTAAVRDAMANTPTKNGSLRALLAPLDLTPLHPQGHEWDDVDTWDDHARWTSRLALDERG